MKRFFTSIAILLSFVWSAFAQQELWYKTDYNIQQKDKYNDVFEKSTIEGEGKDWPMGCMATAMTIVMDYHQYPQKYFGNKTDLPQLMYDAAKSINTQFGPDESSAALSEVALQLVNTFGYDVNSVKYMLKASSGLSDAEWVAMIVRNLQNGMPVIYGAGTWVKEGETNKEVRHAFVIDGIRSSKDAPYAYEFHINGGQGESINGNNQWVKDIFSVTIGSHTYDVTQEMVVGIRTVQEVEKNVSPLKIVSYNGSHGLSMEVDRIELGQPFDASVAALQNWTEDGSAFTGAVYPVLVRTDENGKLVVTPPTNTDDIAVKYTGDAFAYRRTVNRLDFEDVKFETIGNDGKVDLTCYTLRVATCPIRKDGTYDYTNYHLVEVLDGENIDVVSSVPAAQSSTVKIRFEAKNNDVKFYRRVVDVNGMSFPEITGTEVEVPYGKPFLFFVQKATTAGDGSIILTTGGKYLMKDFFATNQWGNQYPDGAFYVTPKGDMVITGKYYITLESRSVDDLTAGGLQKHFEEQGWDPCETGSLTLKGEMNAEDFFYIRDNMPLLTDLDMSEITILPVGSSPANTIPDAAFYKEIYNENGYELALTTVRLPETCEAIGNNAFMYCSKLKEITIPESVNKYNYNVFFGCKSLKKVTVKNPVPVFVNWCVFKGIANGCELHVPQGTKDIYLKQNSLPGKIWAQNHWYERWHEGNPYGNTCVEDAPSVGSNLKVRVVRTNYVTFDGAEGRKNVGTYDYNGGEFKLKNTTTKPVNLGLWMLRAQVKYVGKDGQSVETYVYDPVAAVGTDSYNFDVQGALAEAQKAGAKDAYVKVEVYLDMTKACEARAQKNQFEFNPYIYPGMEATIINGWHPSDNESEMLDFTYFNSSVMSSSGGLTGKATLTLDNARIGRIYAIGCDIDVILKGKNELAGYSADYGEFYPISMYSGLTVSLKGDGSVKLPNYQWVNEEDEHDPQDKPWYQYVANPRINSGSGGGVLNLHHGVTVEGLENVEFDNMKLNYTRTFDRVVSNDGKKVMGWETLALPFDVYRVQKTVGGKPVYWATPGKTGDFWLREMTDGELAFTSDVEQIKAGRAYIISVPDEGNANLTGQALTFVGPTLTGNAQLIQEDELPDAPSFNGGAEDSPMTLTMKPNLYNALPETYYSMNRDGSSFYRNGQEGENVVPLKQFEAYFEPSDMEAAVHMMAFSLRGDVIEDDGTTGICDSPEAASGLKVRGNKGMVEITSDKARRVDIVSLGGIVRGVQVGEGTTHVNLPAGLYIVEGQKVMVK